MNASCLSFATCPWHPIEFVVLVTLKINLPIGYHTRFEGSLEEDDTMQTLAKLLLPSVETSVSYASNFKSFENSNSLIVNSGKLG